MNLASDRPSGRGKFRVPANRISQIIDGKRAVTGDTALRLAHWFDTSPQSGAAPGTEISVPGAANFDLREASAKR